MAASGLFFRKQHRRWDLGGAGVGWGGVAIVPSSSPLDSVDNKEHQGAGRKQVKPGPKPCRISIGVTADSHRISSDSHRMHIETATRTSDPILMPIGLALGSCRTRINASDPHRTHVGFTLDSHAAHLEPSWYSERISPIGTCNFGGYLPVFIISLGLFLPELSDFRFKNTPKPLKQMERKK